MKREREYRIWDKWDGKMIYDLSNLSHKLYVSLDGKIIDWNYGYAKEDSGYYGKANQGQHILMDYIGIKDVNKKKVFEDDVCVATQYLNSKHQRQVVGTISWLDSECGFSFELPRPNPKDLPIEYIAIWSLSDIRIIGNIYENPDLIKKK